MSHFSVVVITSHKPDEDVLAPILQPWHEFECTGIDDQYVQDVDILEEARMEYEGRKNDPDYPTLSAFIESWYGRSAISISQTPDLEDEHKYGYQVVDDYGNVVKAIKRTNLQKNGIGG